jgi:hypothetical protein
MNFFSFVKQYADHIGGQFTDYDQNRSVVVVPLDNRFQTVLATKQKSPVSGKDQAMISSKVCEYKSDMDLKLLLEQNGNFDYSRFVLEDGYLKVEASCLVASVTEDQVREMIQEVAQLADHYELKFTGKDVF